MKKLIPSFLIFTIAIVLGEIYFRQEVKPGFQLNHDGFEIVDSLIVYEDYTTDDYGNYVLSSLLTDTLKAQYDFSNCTISNENFDSRIASTDGVKLILEDFCNLQKLQEPSFPFEHFALGLLQKQNLNELDSAYIDYIKYPFNSDGFRSIDFHDIETNKKKILIVGDSFVWGMTATPYYNSFTDILYSKGYVVYNAGISSVDPLQYLNVCKKYVNTINPDLVIVNFYEGNDVMHKLREHKQGIPHEHITNAGFFESNPTGEYLDAYDAYAYYANKLRIPQEGFLDKILSKSAIGSILWTKLYPNRCANFFEGIQDEDKIKLTKNVLGEIDSYLDAQDPRYFFTITPDVNADYNVDKSTLGYYQEVFDDIFLNFEYYYPTNLKHEDYNEPWDFHFNNQGHLKYANFIDSLIQNKLDVQQ